TGVLSKKEWHKVSEDYDIFINTTNVDNTPVSVMEAMAMGLPVVTTNVGGIPYLLKDGEDAFLVPSNDHVAMTLKIIEIIEGEVNIQQILQAARTKVEQFDWSVVKNGWIDLFENDIPKKGWLDYFYDSSPVFLQNILISAYGVYWKNRRLGGEFKHYLNEFKQRETFSKEQWDNYQTIELRKLLVHAFKTVPFYTDLYSKNGFTLKDFETFELKNISKLPFLEKEDLRKFGKTSLLSTKRKKGAFYNSSGSTGTPVSIYLSKEMHQKWNAAYETRVRNWAGVNSKMARGMIGGRRVIGGNHPVKPFYRYNSAEKQTYFSAYHINEQNSPNYVEGMVKNKVTYMVGYAMSNYFLADDINKNKLKAPKLKAVLTSSEKLTPQMRIAIEKAYQCKVYDAYSGVEACGLISENSDGELLFSPDTGIMEVVDDQGVSVKNGMSGEVIATGLMNFDQPLIRYRIGDRVRMSKNQKTKSGIEIPIVQEIEGRIEDVLITRDGRRIISLYKLFLDIPYLKRSQVIQNTYVDYEIKVVVEPSFSKKEEKIIRNRFFEKIGNDVDLKIHKVNEIPKTLAGKYKLTISKLKDV
ncbi:MAG: glycosyltransferase, partial [Flavobacteriaceae bacterium]|nr:glycosyltransferase [Flavobacteriaceae bacterium]